MKLLPFGLALTFAVSWIAVAPASAVPAEERRCQSALAAAEDLLVNGRDLWLTDFRIYNVEEEYANYPYQSPLELVYVMGGDAAPDMMSSPRLLTSVVQTIRQGCPPVGLVTFAVAESDWATSFGLIGNQIREFECIDPGQEGPTQWGYRGCL